MIEVSYFDIAILTLVSVILGMVIALGIKELPRKRVEHYRKKLFK